MLLWLLFDCILELPAPSWVQSSHWVALAGEPSSCKNYWSIVNDCNGTVSKTIRRKMLPGRREAVVLHQVIGQIRVTGDYGNMSHLFLNARRFHLKSRHGDISSPKAGGTRSSGFYMHRLFWWVETAGQNLGRSTIGQFHHMSQAKD